MRLNFIFAWFFYIIKLDFTYEASIQVINLCEIKYSGSDYSITEKVDESIRTKINDQKIGTGTKYAVFPTLITTYGLVENAYAGNVQSVVTMADLFK